MDSTYIIDDVQLWNSDGIIDKCHVLVKDGVVDKLSDEPITAPYKHIKASGMVLIPAGVDPQVHLRVPGQKEKEIAHTGVAAAIKGGYGAILNMPNTKPVIDNVEVCNKTLEEIAPVEEATGVKVLLSAAITKGQVGKEATDYQGLKDWGVAAFTDDGVGVTDDDIMRQVFAASSESGIPVLQHAETLRHGGILAPGPLQRALKLPPYPASAETKMVARDLELLREYPNAKYHVLHISSKDTIDIVDKAKKSGLTATCEVSPHHLWFCSEDIDESNTSFKMNPPLRSREDREALQKALSEGKIDFVATDHAPHEEEIKSHSFTTAAYGTIGLETALQVLLSLYHQGKLSRERLVAVFSTAPAKFLSLDKSYGQIKAGEVFRAVLLKPDEKQIIKKNHFKGQSKNSCFLGSKLYGKIHRVFLGKHSHICI